ncbi:MAG TPA: ThuA domain-containing protein [Solirubrobacterales bacterium]|nr:ThuA domain-containing protein [Solirubrobacterales bacterium]
MRVIVWSDDRAGAGLEPQARAEHPEGIASTLAVLLEDELGPRAEITVAGIGDPEQGLGAERLAASEVLLWWGHEAHEQVEDRQVERVRAAVEAGLGFIALHSAHHSKPFRALMGTSCDLRWREGGDHELIWAVDPHHPIAAGVQSPIDLGPHEMYGEPFAIPAPEELVFISSFSGGEVFRSGCCFRRGAGRIFYFGPGHETHPVYRHPGVRRVIANAVGWAASAGRHSPRQSTPGEVDPIWSTR